MAGADGVGTGIGENRYTVMLDGRWRIGGFSLDPTFGYQFGNRTTFNTVTPAYGITCNTTPTAATNCTPNKAKISAFLVDVRSGYQLGPLLIQGAVNYTTGNSAKDTLQQHVNFWQPLDTDTSYMADWGNSITALGIDYYQILFGSVAGGVNPGSAIGFDKYGRVQLAAKVSYALTPSLNFGAGWTILYTARKVDTDSITIANGGLLPSFVDRKTGRSARPEGDAQLIGNEVNAAMTWRFAPGLALDIQGGYLFAGGALAHRNVIAPYCDGAGSNGPCITPNGKELQVNDVYTASARVRFTF